MKDVGRLIRCKSVHAETQTPTPPTPPPVAMLPITEEATEEATEEVS